MSGFCLLFQFLTLTRMRKLLILGATLLTLTACQDLTELNKDIKNPETVPAGSLFANATVSLMDFMTSPSVNTNNFRLWAQQWAQTTYADESNYELVERNVNGAAWNTLYAEVIRDARDAAVFIEADDLLSAEAKANQLAMCEVIEVFAFHVLVDIFGDIPYMEAFGDDVTPGYDDDAGIYSAIADRLDAAINTLGGDNGFGSADLIYGGDADAWKTFANSLKLRMAIRLADTNSAKAKSMAESAVASGVFASNSDNFMIGYLSATPHTNPLWVTLVQSGRSDYIATSTMIEPMSALSDPRLPLYYSDEVALDTMGAVGYLGGVYGDNNNYNAFSHPGALQQNPTFPGTLMGYSEVAFLLADAAERGFSVGGDAESFYNAGITASILEWGGSPADADAYIVQPEVAYATAEGDWKQKIGTQKWLALYDKGFEAWSSYRMYDYPVLPIAAQAQIPTPTRYTYPVTEYSLNGDAVEAAAAAIGGDLKATKVFWDAN